MEPCHKKGNPKMTDFLTFMFSKVVNQTNSNEVLRNKLSLSSLRFESKFQDKTDPVQTSKPRFNFI